MSSPIEFHLVNKLRKYCLALLFLGFVCGLTYTVCYGQSSEETGKTAIPEPPSPPRLFVDQVGIVSASESAEIEQYLRTINDSTTVQIVVVVVPTTGEYEINDFAQQLAQKWKIGQKDKNNGVLFLLSINDRKSSIQTGYGLEGAITDVETGAIQDEVMRPLMKQQQYAQAILATTQALYKAAKEDYKPVAPRENARGRRGRKMAPWQWILIGVVILIVLFFRGRGGRGGGGGAGALLPFLLLGGGRGGGGGWSGGGGGGSSFGGFGGGSFGGGGSSGSW
jgi:uncharacterized protein